MTKKFKLDNLDCADCAAKMEAGIKKIDGVVDAKVNFIFRRLTLTAPEDEFEAISHQAAEIVKKIEPDCRMIF